MSHQVMKSVRVGDLPKDERIARGLADFPDNEVVHIAVGNIVKDEPKREPSDLKVPDGMKLESIEKAPVSE